MFRWLARLSINMLVLVFSTVISVLLLEQATRCYLFGSACFDKSRMSSLVPFTLSGFVEASPFGDIHYTLKPGQSGWFKLAQFHSNADGQAETTDYSQQKPPGVYRIIVLGDSYSMASGIDTDKSYHALLETSLNQAAGAHRYEIINFSVGGYNLEQYTAVLEHIAAHWQPDEIWIGFCAFNDFIQHETPLTTRTPFSGWQASSYSTSFALETWRTWQRAKQQERMQNDWNGEISPETQAFIGAEFSRIQKQARELQARVKVIFLDNRPYPAALINNMRTLSAAHGFGFIDVTHAFTGTKLLDYSIHPLDGHPNEAAHRIFSRIIQQHLQPQ